MLIDLNNITIGSDPEFFIVDKEGDAFPSFDIFKGTKAVPEDKGDGYAVLKDNVLVEGNIPPAHSKEEYIHNMKNLKSLISSVLDLAGLKLHNADSMPIKPRYLKHDEANVFGCSAYKNAWEIGSFTADDLTKLTRRSCGDHQHIGYQLTTDRFTKKQMNRHIAKAFDYFVTYPSRLHYNDEFREKYYGNYGVYRDCPAYGLEARALGGYFTGDEYLEWVYEQTIKAITFCADEKNIDKLNITLCPITDDKEHTNAQYKVLGIDLNNQLVKLEKCLEYSL